MRGDAASTSPAGLAEYCAPFIRVRAHCALCACAPRLIETTTIHIHRTYHWCASGRRAHTGTLGREHTPVWDIGVVHELTLYPCDTSVLYSVCGRG
jgi:hypothetical protein